MVNFRFYPTLKSSLIVSSGIYINDYLFSYKTDKIYKIDLKSGEKPIVLYDDKGVWDIRRDNLIIKSQFNIVHPNKLFGPHGIAVSSAKIGVGIRWYSSESKIRGFEFVGVISNVKEELNLDIKLYFEKHKLRKSLILEPILYIFEEGQLIENYELNIGNTKGIVVGQLDKTKIILEGERSEFPVVEVRDKTRPLWEIIANFVSGEDLFNDTVYLTINSEHKDYKYLNRSDKEFTQTLLDEIMINVVTFLVSKGIQESIVNFDSEESNELGTISYVLVHWIQYFGLKDESILDIHRKINIKIREKRK